MLKDLKSANVEGFDVFSLCYLIIFFGSVMMIASDI